MSSMWNYLRKYKPPIDLQENTVPPSHNVAVGRVKPGLFSRIVRMLPWVSMATTTAVLLMILKQSPPLAVQTDPDAAEHVAEKMAQLQFAMQSGQHHSASLNEAEVNRWIRDNLAVASRHEAQQAGIAVPAGRDVTAREAQSSMQDIRMHLTGNQLQAYARFIIYGKEVSLQLDGTLETQNGSIRLRPTAAKIGSLPIPSFTLDRVVRELFDSPQNREQFQLPPEIESVRIENSSLVIDTR